MQLEALLRVGDEPPDYQLDVQNHKEVGKVIGFDRVFTKEFFEELSVEQESHVLVTLVPLALNCGELALKEELEGHLCEGGTDGLHGRALAHSRNVFFGDRWGWEQISCRHSVQDEAVGTNIKFVT